MWTVTAQRDNQPRTSGGRASFQMEETGKLGKRHEGGREKGKRVWGGRNHGIQGWLALSSLDPPCSLWLKGKSDEREGRGSKQGQLGTGFDGHRVYLEDSR